MKIGTLVHCAVYGMGIVVCTDRLIEGAVLISFPLSGRTLRRGIARLKRIA